MDRVLVISPHPDDESIGCGGTLRRHALRGDKVHVVFLTSGEAGGHGRPEDETRSIREQEAAVAAKILGLDGIEFWSQPDGKLRATSGVIQRLRRKIRDFRPAVVYVTHEREMHADHRAAVRIVDRAVWRIKPRPKVLMFEVWTPMQDMDHIEDISDVIEEKIAAVRAYRSQCDVLRFDDAILGLNRYRGEMHSWPGGPYAEVFSELRR